MADLYDPQQLPPAPTDFGVTPDFMAAAIADCNNVANIGNPQIAQVAFLRCMASKGFNDARLIYYYQPRPPQTDWRIIWADKIFNCITNPWACLIAPPAQAPVTITPIPTNQPTPSPTPTPPPPESPPINIPPWPRFTFPPQPTKDRDIHPSPPPTVYIPTPPIPTYDPNTPTTYQPVPIPSVYGCLVSSPLWNDYVTVPQCYNKYFGYQFNQGQQAAFKKYVSSTLGDSTSTLDDGAAIVIANPFAPNDQPKEESLIFGGSQIQELMRHFAQRSEAARMSLVYSVPAGVKLKKCSVSGAVKSGKIPYSFSSCDAPPPDECFVPIRNFSDNIPGNAGWKTQLQIKFIDPATGSADREISIPHPYLDCNDSDVAAALISAVGSLDITFGQIKTEVDCAPYGYIRFYANTQAEGDAILKNLSKLVNGGIIVNSIRYSQRNRGYKVGTFKAVRAYIFQFKQGTQPFCIRLDLRSLPNPLTPTHNTQNLI